MKWVIAILLILAACAPVQEAQPITEPLCKAPYIEWQEGKCCLDQNANGICDRDEIQQIRQPERKPEPKEEPTIMQKLLKEAPTKYAFHNFLSGVVLVVGDKRRALMDPVSTRATDLYWDLSRRKGWTVCDSDTEMRLLGDAYDPEVARCTPGFTDVREMTETEYAKSFVFAQSPVDWIEMYSNNEPDKVEDHIQQLGARSISPVIYFTNPYGETTVLKFDKYYKVPVRIEKTKLVAGQLQKEIVNYEFYKDGYEDYLLTEAEVTPPEPIRQIETPYELKVLEIYPTSSSSVRVRGYLKNDAEIKTSPVRVIVECVDKRDDIIGSDMIFVSALQPDKTEKWETDVDLNVEDLKTCYVDAQEYIWSWG